VTEYTYDASHRMLTLKDPRGITYLTNSYDSNGRVITQTQADQTTYQYAYTVDVNNAITQTDVTDPRGIMTEAYHGSGRLLEVRLYVAFPLLLCAARRELRRGAGPRPVPQAGSLSRPDQIDLAGSSAVILPDGLAFTDHLRAR
jgi:hypothetical protein